MSVEIIGFIASGIVLLSACSNTTTNKGILLLRGLNILGSLLYIYYGFQIHSLSLVLLDSCMVCVNVFYLYKHFRCKGMKE